MLADRRLAPYAGGHSTRGDEVDRFAAPLKSEPHHLYRTEHVGIEQLCIRECMVHQRAAVDDGSRALAEIIVYVFGLRGSALCRLPDRKS